MGQPPPAWTGGWVAPEQRPACVPDPWGMPLRAGGGSGALHSGPGHLTMAHLRLPARPGGQSLRGEEEQE